MRVGVRDSFGGRQMRDTAVGWLNTQQRCCFDTFLSRERLREVPSQKKHSRRVWQSRPNTEMPLACGGTCTCGRKGESNDFREQGDVGRSPLWHMTSLLEAKRDRGICMH